MSVAASAAGGGDDGKRPSQQAIGAGDVARPQQLADAAAGNHIAANTLFGIQTDLETQLAAEFAQPFHIAAGAMSETEVEAFVHFTRVQALGKDVARKVEWVGQRKVAGEGQQQYGVNAG